MTVRSTVLPLVAAVVFKDVSGKGMKMIVRNRNDGRVSQLQPHHASYNLDRDDGLQRHDR